MTNFRPSAHKFKYIAALFALVLILLLGGPILYLLRQVAFSLGGPIWQAERGVFGGEAEAENESALLARIGALEEENVRLSLLLGHLPIEGGRLAHILSSITSSPYDTFIIDEGEDQGLSVSDRVVSPEGVALGKLVEVYPHVSKALLYSAYGENLEVVLPDGTHVVAYGAGSQNFLLKLPRGVLVSEGSRVTLPGGEKFVLGLIERVEEGAGDSFQRIYARSPLNMSSLSSVYVSR